MKKGLIAAGLLVFGGLLFAQDAYIKEFSGTVETKQPGAAEWSAAQAGEHIQNATMISTGFKSTAIIAIGNSTLLVRALTRLSFEEIQNINGNESVELYLQSGRVRANVNPPSSGKTDFTVRAPTATASVRGTSFEFNGEDLVVDEGRVHITGGDGSAVDVGAGHAVFSNPETGMTTGAVETAREELAPALPIAAAGSVPEPAAITPDTVDADFGVEWRE
jgi:hypothetical protein